MDDGSWQRRHHGGFLWPIILIVLGAIFLLNNFGVLPWGVWDSLWRLWPIILVVWGLEAIFGHSKIVNGIISFLVFVLIAFIVVNLVASSNSTFDNWLRGNFSWWPSSSWINTGKVLHASQSVKQDDYKDVTKRLVKVDIGAIQANISDNDSTNYLTLDASYYEPNGVPAITAHQDDKTLTLDVVGNKGPHFSWIGSLHKLIYDIKIGQPALPTDLDIDLGAGQANIDFSTLKLGATSINVGAGEADITLSSLSLPTEQTQVDVGTGSVKLTLPKGVGLKINHNIGVGEMKIDDQTVKGDGTYQSSDYATATFKLDLKVNVGVGSITIITK
jgi:hypothetical protein